MLLFLLACRQETPPPVVPEPTTPPPEPEPQSTGATGATGATGTTAETGAAECVEGTHGKIWNKPCDELCLPSDVGLAVTAAAPVPCFTALGHPCAGQTDEGGFIYTIPGAPGTVVVLLPGVAGAFDAAFFAAAFGVVTVAVPLAEVTESGPAFVHSHRFEQATPFTFVDGRVTATLAFDAVDARLNWIGYDPDCLYLDYYLDCICDYDGFSVPVEVALDVVLADPTGP